MSNQPQQTGERLFTDGTIRPVFEAPDGRQYVEDDGERVYGTWLPPDDAANAPVIVHAGPNRASATAPLPDRIWG
jgi:hypothetical protein